MGAGRYRPSLGPADPRSDGRCRDVRYARTRWGTRCDAGLRGPVRPPAAPDPASRRSTSGRSRSRRSSTRTSPSSSACDDARPRRRHRVPAHRRDARRAQGPAPAARASRTLELDEELLRFEERDLLLARLLECKTFKDAADALAGADAAAPTAASPRVAGPEEPLPLAGARPARARRGSSALRGRGARVLAAPPARASSTPSTSRPIRASVARRDRRRCSTACRRGSRCTFRDARRRRRRPASRSIVRFLAVLELYKQGVVDLEQFENFGDAARCAALVGGRRTALDDGERRRLGRRAEPRRAGDRARTPKRRAATTSTIRRSTPRADEARRADRGGRARAPTEPVEPRVARRARRAAGRRRSRRSATSSPRGVRGDAAAASCSRASPAATASRRIPTSRRTSSGSCSKASTCASRARRSRRSRSSRTSSRSRAGRSRRSAA